MTRFWWMIGLASLVAFSACSGTPELEGPESPEPLEPVGQKTFAITVEQAVSAGCSTSQVKGLSLQIVAQQNCLIPNALSEVPSGSNISIGSNIFPYMQTAARDALVKAAKAKPSTTMTVSSMFRSLAQQYLLYRWYLAGKCSITLAAKPGNSAHETGRALDISEYSTWKSTLESNGFSWQGSNDPWHYTYVGSGTHDLSGTSVKAFQMLWNINNPGDLIDEDGIYGPQTEARLKASPAGGFAIPPNCNPNDPPEGVLDTVSCDEVGGWAQDPDEPAKAIDVHVYFGGPSGDANAKGVPTHAAIHRDDLCGPLGSCEHGFSLPSPLSLHDGKPHAVHAYGIDSAGGANAQLQSSPKNLECAPQIPAGVRRHILSQDVMQAWKLDSFWHVMPVSDAQLSAIDESTDLPSTPQLVKADDGSSAVWLIDGPWRRHVPNPAVAAAWGFDLTQVATLPAAELNAMPEGTNVRGRPVLVKATGPAVYLIDDEQKTAEPTDGGVASDAATGKDGSVSEAGTGGSTGQPDGGTAGAAANQAAGWESAGSDSGCSVRPRSSRSDLAWAAMALLALLAAGRRRAS